jgi:hypothetical protein
MKRYDFLHKLSTYYAREYDLVAVEEVNMWDDRKSVEQPQHGVCRVVNVPLVAQRQVRT